MDREAVTSLIGRVYQARASGDIDTLMDAFHPDARFTLAGSREALPVAGSVRGYSEVRSSLAEFIKAFDFLDRGILSILVDCDSAAARSRLSVKFNSTGTVFDGEVLDIFKFEDGKIVELIEYVDTALLKDVMDGAQQNAPSAPSSI